MSRETGWYRTRLGARWEISFYESPCKLQSGKWWVNAHSISQTDDFFDDIDPTPVNPVPADGEPSAKDFIDFLHYALIDDCETLRHVDGLFSVFIETRVVKEGDSNV